MYCDFRWGKKDCLEAQRKTRKWREWDIADESEFLPTDNIHTLCKPSYCSVDYRAKERTEIQQTWPIGANQNPLDLLNLTCLGN